MEGKHFTELKEARYRSLYQAKTWKCKLVLLRILKQIDPFKWWAVRKKGFLQGRWATSNSIPGRPRLGLWSEKLAARFPTTSPSAWLSWEVLLPILHSTFLISYSLSKNFPCHFAWRFWLLVNLVIHQGSYHTSIVFLWLMSCSCVESVEQKRKVPWNWDSKKPSSLVSLTFPRERNSNS